jgi:hypothetical protein
VTLRATKGNTFLKYLSAASKSRITFSRSKAAMTFPVAVTNIDSETFTRKDGSILKAKKLKKQKTQVPISKELFHKPGTQDFLKHSKL